MMASDNVSQSPSSSGKNGAGPLNGMNGAHWWTLATAVCALVGVGGGGTGLLSTITSQGERITRLESQMEQIQFVTEKMDGKLDRLLEKKP